MINFIPEEYVEFFDVPQKLFSEIESYDVNSYLSNAPRKRIDMTSFYRATLVPGKSLLRYPPHALLLISHLNDYYCVANTPNQKVFLSNHLFFSPNGIQYHVEDIFSFKTELILNGAMEMMKSFPYGYLERD